MPTLIRAKKSVKLRQVLLFKRGQLNQAEAFFWMSNTRLTGFVARGPRASQC